MIGVGLCLTTQVSRLHDPIPPPTPGALGGFVGPMLLGSLRQSSGNYNTGMIMLGAFLGFAAISIGLLNPAWAERWMLKAQAAGSGEAGCSAAGAADFELAAAKAMGGAVRFSSSAGGGDRAPGTR